jgi:molecular chaperone GrpE
MTDSENKGASGSWADAPEDAAAGAAAGVPERDASEEAANEEAIGPFGGSAEIERLEAEKADLTDRLLRLAADMDNLRRRTEREIADARKYAVSKFAGDMLVVGDNLRRAVEAVPADRREGDEATKALVEGVEMTEREMERLLEKHGVTRIEALGTRFDPHRHQAVFEVPDASVPEGTVVQVLQDGYAIGDRVLRAAMVGVSRGGPKPGEETAPPPA